jgi:uncharacterized protein (TIGR00266 family)
MLNYEIVGDDMQGVIIKLARDTAIRAEAGSMMYMTSDVEMDTSLGGAQGGGLMGGLMSGLKRVVAGESLFVTTFRTRAAQGEVAFAGPYPGKIIHLDLNQSGDVLCQRDSFLCSENTVDISIAFTRKLGAGLFGGEGFILQKLAGSGSAFIHAGGMVVKKELARGESLKVDTGCLVAMTSEVDYDIQMVKGVKSMLFGGEGLFFAHLTGPGTVYLQTLPFSRMADRIMVASRTGGEESKGIAGIGGDLLGGLLSGND